MKKDISRSSCGIALLPARVGRDERIGQARKADASFMKGRKAQRNGHKSTAGY
ncbi:MAG: hypothetical protein IJ074_06000 [Clostridia bacterium]|nr:hypothetical protein [Clostridia bacterium]